VLLLLLLLLLFQQLPCPLASCTAAVLLTDQHQLLQSSQQAQHRCLLQQLKCHKP
jgi:hypothetical protein